MHIVSWNVAGLSTTLAKIDADYGPSSIAAEENMLGDKKKRKASHAFEHYLKDLHQIDILAVQEHKIPLSQLSSRNDPYCVSMLEEYESFWCCNTDHKAKGMNGVCTFAKKGTVVRANAAPLGRPELDKQGRCIMTDHSFFVLFNVYVPCTNNGNNKMEFLEALQAAMSAEREKGRHVILVGDLNIAHKPRDRFWKWRPVCIEKIFEIASQGGPNWAMDVKKNWPQVEKALKTREVRSTAVLQQQYTSSYNMYLFYVLNSPVACLVLVLGRTKKDNQCCYKNGLSKIPSSGHHKRKASMSG